MATTKAKKATAAEKSAHLEKGKAALGDLGGAMTGGMLGAFAPPWASGLGGVALLGLGAFSGKSWVTSTGAAMLVSTVATTQATQRMAPGGKFDLKTELYNGKQRVGAFMSALKNKFTFKPKPALPAASMDTEGLDGLGTTDRAHLTALDELNQAVVSQGLLQAGASHPMVYQGQPAIY